MSVRYKVDRFLTETQMPPTRFGRLAINDPRLVDDLHNGREPRARTAARIEAYIAAALAQGAPR